MIVTNLNRDDPRPDVQAYLKDYEARFKIQPDMVGASAYDAFMLICDGIKKAGSTQGKAVRSAIAATKDFNGLTGVITGFKAGEVVKEVQVQVVKGGASAISPSSRTEAIMPRPRVTFPQPFSGCGGGFLFTASGLNSGDADARLSAEGLHATAPDPRRMVCFSVQAEGLLDEAVAARSRMAWTLASGGSRGPGTSALRCGGACARRGPRVHPGHGEVEDDEVDLARVTTSASTAASPYSAVSTRNPASRACAR